ncbi:MAG: tetratricopeptide repeat-containing diguanylate cyclase [Armatimonadota bacterium]
MASVDTEENTTLTMADTSWRSAPVSADLFAVVQDLLEKADACYSTDTLQSLRISEQAIALITAPPTSQKDASSPLRIELTARSHIALARCLERQSHFEASIAESEKARALLEPLCRADSTLTSECISAYSNALQHLGNASQRMGRHLDALNYYQTELQFLETMGEREPQVSVRNAIASVAYHIGDYATSMECALTALSLAQETNQRRGQGSSLNLLGNVYFKRGDYQASIDSYQRSLAVFTELKDRYWQAGVIGNHANVCLKIGDYQQAREMHFSSLHLREAIGDRQGQAHSLLDIGSVYAGRYETDADVIVSQEVKPALALRYYKKALRLFEQVGDNQGIASCRIRIGNLYALSSRIRRALPYGYGALALAEEAGIREHIYESHCLLSDVHERLGDYDLALKHFKQFHSVKEAVFNAENEERVRNLEITYRVTQAKQDTDAQRRLSERLSVTVKALRASDSEKAHLLIKLRQQAALLERQVRTDALTGLLNRRMLDSSLPEEWARARQEGSTLCIVLCDVDHFKQINDHFSHQAGDEVLRQISLLFHETLRETDIVARYGGEEFVFILQNTTLDEAQRLCEKIRVSVNTNHWEQVQADLQVSVSMGICEVFGALLDGSPEQALRSADAALYQAKRQGRNRICNADFAS